MKKEKDYKIKRKNAKKNKPREHFTHITLNDRLKIEAWEKANVPVDEMATMLGKNPSSIYRELKRGKYKRQNTDLTFTTAYSPEIADDKYREI